MTTAKQLSVFKNLDVLFDLAALTATWHKTG